MSILNLMRYADVEKLSLGLSSSYCSVCVDWKHVLYALHGLRFKGKWACIQLHEPDTCHLFADSLGTYRKSNGKFTQEKNSECHYY